MTANGPQKGCLICIAIASLAILAAAAAPYWLKTDVPTDVAYGLWYSCIDGDCKVYDGWEDVKPEDSEWFIALRATAGLSSLFAIFAFIVSLAKLCQESYNTKNIGILAIVTGVLGIAAVAIFFENQTASILNFDSDNDDNWSNSPVVLAVGSCLIGIIGIFAIAMPEDTSAVGPV